MRKRPRNPVEFDDDRQKINARMKVDDAMRAYYRGLMARVLKDNDRFVSRFMATLVQSAAKPNPSS